MKDATIEEQLAKANLTPEELAYFASRQETSRLDNQGNEIVQNRAARRKRPATDVKYTKNNHSQKLKKLGKKKARK